MRPLGVLWKVAVLRSFGSDAWEDSHQIYLNTSRFWIPSVRCSIFSLQCLIEWFQRNTEWQILASWRHNGDTWQRIFCLKSSCVSHCRRLCQWTASWNLEVRLRKLNGSNVFENRDVGDTNAELNNAHNNDTTGSFHLNAWWFRLLFLSRNKMSPLVMTTRTRWSDSVNEVFS